MEIGADPCSPRAADTARGSEPLGKTEARKVQPDMFGGLTPGCKRLVLNRFEYH